MPGRAPAPLNPPATGHRWFSTSTVAASRFADGLMDAVVPLDAKNGSRSDLENHTDRGFTQRPQPSSLFSNHERRYHHPAHLTRPPKRIRPRWSLTSIQQRFVKTGGRLVKHARYYLGVFGREPSVPTRVRDDAPSGLRATCPGRLTRGACKHAGLATRWQLMQCEQPV